MVNSTAPGVTAGSSVAMLIVRLGVFALLLSTDLMPSNAPKQRIGSEAVSETSAVLSTPLVSPCSAPSASETVLDLALGPHGDAGLGDPSPAGVT